MNNENKTLIENEDGIDVTNRVVKVCRRIEELEYRLACKDMDAWDSEDARYELEDLEDELETLHPATFTGSER